MNLLKKCSEDCCFLGGGIEGTDHSNVCKKLNCEHGTTGTHKTTFTSVQLFQ